MSDLLDTQRDCANPKTQSISNVTLDTTTFLTRPDSSVVNAYAWSEETHGQIQAPIPYHEDDRDDTYDSFLSGQLPKIPDRRRPRHRIPKFLLIIGVIILGVVFFAIAQLLKVHTEKLPTPDHTISTTTTVSSNTFPTISLPATEEPSVEPTPTATIPEPAPSSIQQPATTTPTFTQHQDTSPRTTHRHLHSSNTASPKKTPSSTTTPSSLPSQPTDLSEEVSSSIQENDDPTESSTSDKPIKMTTTYLHIPFVPVPIPVPLPAQ